MRLKEMSADKQAGGKGGNRERKQLVAQKKKKCTTRQATQTQPSFLADLQALHGRKFKKMEKVHHLYFGNVHHLCFPIQPRWGFYFDFEHFHKKEVDERKSNEKRAKDLKPVTVRKHRVLRAYIVECQEEPPTRMTKAIPTGQ